MITEMTLIESDETIKELLEWKWVIKHLAEESGGVVGSEQVRQCSW